MGKNNYRGAAGENMPKGDRNIDKKGSSGIYDKNPALPNYPHSMGPSTIPIKFAESDTLSGKTENQTRRVVTGSDKVRSPVGAAKIMTSSNPTRNLTKKK